MVMDEIDRRILQELVMDGRLSVTELAEPSAAALPATVVPRTPIVIIGVLTSIASSPVFAILPETNEKTP